ETGREMKSGSVPLFALHPDAAFHHLDQSPGDGQSQTGSTVPARGRAVGLSERLEDGGLFFRCDTDTRVADTEMQFHCSRIFRFAFHPQRDTATFSEFDGIPNQIVNNLLQACWIAQHHFRDLWMKVTIELQMFL